MLLPLLSTCFRKPAMVDWVRRLCRRRNRRSATITTDSMAIGTAMAAVSLELLREEDEELEVADNGAEIDGVVVDE